MTKVKRLLYLALVTVLSVVGVPMTAKAASVGTQACTIDEWGWLKDPACAGSRTTIYQTGNVALRVGSFNGQQFGWGKKYKGDYVWIRFEVDKDGDRKRDTWDYSGVKAPTYTKGYPTSSSSDRAFRVCGERADGSGSCTPWW